MFTLLCCSVLGDTRLKDLFKEGRLSPVLGASQALGDRMVWKGVFLPVDMGEARLRCRPRLGL